MYIELYGALSKYCKNYREISLPPLNGSGGQCAVGTVAGDPVTGDSGDMSRICHHNTDYLQIPSHNNRF